MRLRAAILYLCFFLSGASALVYEVVWQRQLTLVFGLSTYSVAAVLAAFFAGLALGARIFGRVADTTKRPATVYATIEIGVAVTGAASALLVPLILRVFVMLCAPAEHDWLVTNLIRFALAFAALCIPCVLIGATVPLMARLVVVRAGRVAVAFSRFYTVNTLGGMFGAALAGFFLIRILGVKATLVCAVIGNVTAAALALTTAKRAPRAGTDSIDSGERGVSEAVHATPQNFSRDLAPQSGIPNTPHPRFALIVALVAGFVALAYEVVWIRLLAVYTLNSVYVFTMVVTVYLAALAVGTALAARLLRSPRFNAAKALVFVQILLALLVPCLLGLVPSANRLDIARTDAAEQSIFLAEYVLTLAVVFVPTVLLGLTLPLVVALYAGDVDHTGRTVARIYAFNSLGTIAGSALTGALLIPLVGLRGTLLLLAVANMFTAAAADILSGEARRTQRVVLPIAGACFALLIAIMPATTEFRRARQYSDDLVLYYAEGPSATIHVEQINGVREPYRMLFVDSKSVAGTYPEIVTDQKMLAHLPLLLHPSPERALTVGFGTGGTSYSMLLHHVQVDCVEIEPKVPAAHRFFESENHGMVGPEHEQANFHLILDDARAWLNIAPKPYDVIVTDVTSIQYRGNGNLYTTDYFRLMREKLAPGGIAGAWVPISGITEEQLKILIASFQKVYPHTSVWYMLNLPTDFVILIGSDDELSISLGDIAARMHNALVHRDLAETGLANPYKLAACLLLADDDVAAYVGDAPLHTDNHPVLDYLTHASPYKNSLAENLREMSTMRTNPADYVTSWPTMLADEARETPEATWKRWWTASNALLEGHAAISKRDTGWQDEVRDAYRTAEELIPEDDSIERLVESVDDHP